METTQKYGPNHEQVEEFLGNLNQLTVEHALELIPLFAQKQNHALKRARNLCMIPSPYHLAYINAISDARKIMARRWQGIDNQSFDFALSHLMAAVRAVVCRHDLDPRDYEVLLGKYADYTS